MEDIQQLHKYQETKDLKDLSTLYEPYMGLVYGLCLKYLKNEADARDGVMDIFEKLTKKALTSKVENFKAWLYVVVKYHCFEKLRRKKTVGVKESDAALMYSQEVFHPDTVDNEQEIKLLQLCITKLEEFQQKCIELFYFKKMSYQDIAANLNLQYNQVRSRIQNGRRNIKMCMESNTKKMQQ